MRPAVSAFVLAGGAGRRMGAPKAALRIAGQALVSRSVRCLRHAGLPAVVLGPRQLASVLASDGLPAVRIVPDEWPGQGPLPALRAALSQSHSVWNLAVACDLPLLTPRLLRVLMDLASRSRADAVIPVSAEGRPQPLCGLYHRRSLVALNRSLAAGDLRMFGLLNRIRCQYVPWVNLARSGCRPAELLNLNRPAQLARLRIDASSPLFSHRDSAPRSTLHAPRLQPSQCP